MLSQFIKRATLFLPAAALACLVGCASTPNIGYKIDPVAAPSKNVDVKVNSFTDGRSTREMGVIGGLYNGYGMRMGDVFEPQGLVRSLENAFKAELANSGYKVTDESKDIVIDGVVEGISCEIRNGQNSSFVVRFKVSDRSQEVINKTYQGKKTIHITFDTSGSDSINAAMKQLIKNFIKDLDEYIAT